MSATRVHTYLTMTSGTRAGATYPLDADQPNTIGRGDECRVVVPDPLCSRVHALLEREGEVWRLRDADSRNGTFLDERKVDEAVITHGAVFRIGSSKFAFHQSAQPPTVASSIEQDADDPMLQTIVMNTPVDLPPLAPDIIPDLEQSQELLLLYQLAIKLLGCEDPDQVVSIALDLLSERTGAALVGFLSLDDEGQLRPRQVVPAEMEQQVALSQSLTDLVIRQRHAIWVANQQTKAEGGNSATLKHYADAVCMPLVKDHNTFGAIHLYQQRSRFRQSDFDFAISVANIVSVALVRAREHVHLQSDYQQLVAKSPGHDELVGQSAPMEKLKARINRVAKAAGCVLIRGESGSGKELVARAVHRAGPRADRPMLSVNCAAIPDDLMESQLFGHRVGAFTGADRDHKGYFQQADMGTLFLDEVGELTLEGQAKLLRILEGHPFLPVGATDEVRVDVRVIAATNQNLETYVREKHFREDLYYRLSVFELQVPPLRDRGEDIGRLIDFFLDSFRQQHGRPKLKFSDKAKERLIGYHWPGNVRQLRNVIDSAVVMAEGPAIQPSELGLHDVGSGELESLKLDHWERKLIREALKRSGNNVPDAAKLLGIGRATLYRKIEQYGIDR